MHGSTASPFNLWIRKWMQPHRLIRDSSKKESVFGLHILKTSINNEKNLIKVLLLGLAAGISACTTEFPTEYAQEKPI